MQENIELKNSDKIRLKTVSAQRVMHMKDLLIKEAKIVIDNNHDIPRVEREKEENRTSLIIKVDDDLKERIKNYCDIKSVRIRDFWVECVHRIIKEAEDDFGKSF